MTAILSYLGLIFAFALSDHWQNCNYLWTIKAIPKFVCNFQEKCKTFFPYLFSSTQWRNKSKNEMVKQIALSMEIIGETFFQSSCLKPLYERSSGRLLLFALSFKSEAKPENSKKSESWSILKFKKWSRNIVDDMLIVKKCHVRFILHFALAAKVIYGRR